ncbi:MAG: lytic transglycosylase domain-containing protein [Pseudomonadota bacterium]
MTGGIRALLLALVLPVAAAAAPAPQADRLAARCEAAALQAARAEGVPPRLFRALSLAETGRRLEGEARPWPWTVNMEGEGRWFETPDALLAWVRARRAEGARSFDLGCFQVNHLWHGEAFDSLEQMLDPAANARYAARFLRALREETGDWEAAVGLYHSRTHKLAGRYRARVLRIMAGLPSAAGPEVDLAALPAAPAGDAWPGVRGAPRPIARPSGVDPTDAAADAAAASLARAWIDGRKPGPLIEARADARGLLRAARPLVD